MVPVAGSAYTYAYATLGEIVAWIIGWDSDSRIRRLRRLRPQRLVQLPPKPPRHEALGRSRRPRPRPVDYQLATGHIITTGAIVNLPAVLLAIFITILLVKGIRESAGFNAAMVILKVGVIVAIIAVGALFVDPRNWRPFAPFGWGGLSLFGQPVFGMVKAGLPVGVLAGSGMIFFAYIGFDSVSTHAEEAHHPQRDVPIGIIASLLVCTALYIGVAAVLTGMVRYDRLTDGAPVAFAFQQVGFPVAQFIVALAALAGLTSAASVLMLSQARISLAMARDGLVPKRFFGAVHPRFRTPWKATLVTGAFVMLLCGFLPLNILADLVNIGTLFAFLLVCAGILVLRYTQPDAPRAFRTPLVPLVPALGILTCLLLMCSLPAQNWYRLLAWLLIGMLIYLGYGRKHSVMNGAS